MRVADQDYRDIHALRRHLEYIAGVIDLYELNRLAGCLVGNQNSVVRYDEASIAGLDNDLDPIADLAAAGGLVLAVLAGGRNLIAYIAAASDGCGLKRYRVCHEECLDRHSAVRHEDIALSVCKLALLDVILAVNRYFEPVECIAVSCQRAKDDLAADCGFHLSVLGEPCVIDNDGIAVAAAVECDTDLLIVADELSVDRNTARRHGKGVLLGRAVCRSGRNKVAVSVAGNGQVELIAVSCFARAVLQLDGDKVTGLCFSDGISIGVVGVEYAALDSIDNDRVIGLTKGQLDFDVTAGHGEGIVENADRRAGLLLGNRDAGQSVAIHCLPDDGDLSALCGLARAEAVYLKVEAAVDTVGSVEVICRHSLESRLYGDIVSRHDEAHRVVHGDKLLQS